MAKIDSGKMELNPEIYDYNEFRQYIDSVFTPLCLNKQINFIWNPGNTSLAIYVDILRFNQVFFNLLSNAVKYTPKGGTIVYAVENNVVKDGLLTCDYVVKDTGKGMSEEFQKRMFEPFSLQIKSQG